MPLAAAEKENYGEDGKNQKCGEPGPRPGSGVLDDLRQWYRAGAPGLRQGLISDRERDGAGRAGLRDRARLTLTGLRVPESAGINIRIQMIFPDPAPNASKKPEPPFMFDRGQREAWDFELSIDGLRDRESITRRRPPVEFISRKDRHVVCGTWQQPKLP